MVRPGVTQVVQGADTEGQCRGQGPAEDPLEKRRASQTDGTERSGSDTTRKDGLQE